MMTHVLAALALAASIACSRPGGEFVGRWTPVVEQGRASMPAMLVGEDTLEIRRDGDRFQVTVEGTIVPAHLTQEGQLKLDGLIPMELSYSKERDSIYLMGVRMQRLE
jgi:hypothetical protein